MEPHQLNPAWTDQEQQEPPQVGILVITATLDPEPIGLRLKVRHTDDVISRRDEALDTRDVAEVLSIVEQWLSRFRDAGA